MKKFIVAFVLALMTTGSFAQFVGDMEVWDSLYSSKEEPYKWITLNLFCSPLVDVSNPRSVYKIQSPNQAAGTTSMKIKTVKMNTNPTQGLLNDTSGIAMTGTISISPFALIDRVAYTARPLNIHFQYQYKPLGSPTDTALAYVELTKWNTSLLRRDTIATGVWWTYTTVNSWTVMTLPLFYWPNHPATTYPDSVSIVFSSSAIHPKLGSELWVDDVYFTGWNSVQDLSAASAHVSMFPNPAKDNITISADLDNAQSVIVYDGIGQVIGKFEMSNKKYVLNTSELKAGNYYFSVMDKGGVVITGNTFTVVK